MVNVPTVNSIVETLTDMRSEYAASQPTKWLERPTDVIGMGTGGNYHIRDEYKFHYLVEMSRHIERDDPAVSQGFGRFINNVVQGGYTYVPDTGYDKIDRELFDRWATYTDPDNRNLVDQSMRHDWHTFEELSARRMLVDGDIAFVPLNNGRLQQFEAHRIISPSRDRTSRRYTVHGVEHNRSGQVVRYWLQRRETDGFADLLRRGNRDVRGVRAWQMDDLTGQPEASVIHCFNPKRFSQSRGIPALAAVMNTAGMHADLQFANLVKAQVASYIGFIHDIPMSANEEYSPPEPEMVYDQTLGKMVAKGHDLAPGSSHYPTYAGEKIEAFTSNIPNPEFFSQAKMLLTFVACTIDMPLILFMLDASETNFSAWRGAMQQFQIAAKRFQTMHSRVFHRKVVRWKQRQWLRQSASLRTFFATAGPDYFRHQWRFPTWKHVQPLEDVRAEVMELGNLLDSPRAIAARHNREFDRIIKETCEDRAMAIQCGLDKAMELNKHPYIIENPHETVTWREVMPLPLAESQQMQLLSGSPEQPEPESETSDESGLQAEGKA